MVKVACALGKTVSEVLREETMARFSVTLKHLPRIEYERYRMEQAATAGSLPNTYEEYMSGFRRGKGEVPIDEERDDTQEIQAFHSDIIDLQRRSEEIRAAKRAKGIK